MSSRATLILLDPKVCKAAYMHCGCDMIDDLIYRKAMSEEILDLIFNTAKENGNYQEYTNEKDIEQLYRYIEFGVNMDADITIFVEKRSCEIEGHTDWQYYDVKIQSLCWIPTKEERLSDCAKQHIRCCMGVFD